MKGSCLCGAVRWETGARPRDVVACHCGQCRKQSGHVWAASQVPADSLAIAGEVRWFQASDAARRGFCPACGSVLFWQPLEGGAPGPTVSFAAGSVDGATGLGLSHIFTADKGDYYAIPDSEPQRKGDL